MCKEERLFFSDNYSFANQMNYLRLKIDRNCKNIACRWTTMPLLAYFKAHTNLNRLFQQFLIFYGKYDGKKVIQTSTSHLLCRIANWTLFVIFLKYAILIPGQEAWLARLLGDFLDFESGRTQIYTSVVFADALLWTWLSMNAYQRLNTVVRESFWLVFLPFDLQHTTKKFANKKVIAGMHRKEFHHLQQRYLLNVKHFMSFFHVFTILGSLVAIGLHMYRFYCEIDYQYYHWVVFMINCLMICFSFNLMFALVMGMPLNFSFLTYLQRKRFQNVGNSFISLSKQSQPKRSKISFHVHEFNSIVSDLLKINRFWSKIFGINYFITMFQVSLIVKKFCAILIGKKN